MEELNAPMNRRVHIEKQQGVTLLELMVVVVVVAILGMIALPSYRQYSMRAQRTEAKTALLQLATAQERFYLQNNTYTANFAALQLTGMSENNVYTLAVPLANAARTTSPTENCHGQLAGHGPLISGRSC